MESSIIVVARCNDSDTRLWNSLIDNKLEPKKTYKYSVGTFIKVNNNPYVLACYHGIQNHFELYLYQLIKSKGNKYSVNKITAKAKCFSDELDLALLTFDSNVSNIQYIDIDSFLEEQPLINNKLIIKYNQTKKISEEFLIKEDKVIELIMKGITFEKYSSFNMPELPYFKCTIKDLSDDKLTILKGLSGIQCQHNDKIIGMLINYSKDDNCIKIIPSSIIRLFINEYMIKHTYDGITGIMLKYDITEINHNNNKYNGIIVDSTYNIKYEEPIKKNDIIIKINQKNITKDGFIFDDKLRLDIPFETYISMNFMSDSNIQMNIMRRDSKNETFKEIIANIKVQPLYKIRTIPINHNNIFFTIDGFVFTELTENIIEFYRNHNIIIAGDIMEKYAIDSFGPIDQSKVVVLVNVINSEFNKNNVELIRNIGLPLIKKNNTKNQYYMCILETINKQKVNKLSDIEKNISEKNIFKMGIDKNIKLSVNFTKTNLSITYIGK